MYTLDFFYFEKMTTQIGSHFCLFYSQKKGPRDIEIVGIKAQIASVATIQWHSAVVELNDIRGI